MGNNFQIPDYELVIEIERGSYGQVWLARSVLGAWRAIKIVQRSLFEDARPYQREFNGIRHYEAISRGHAGLIDVLHVGRNEEEGYFYYVMELADDQVVGQNIRSADYSPRSLQSELNARGAMPADEASFVGAELADALQYLHEHGLVHRDIKPSNIVYVNGRPKLADIGLISREGFSSFSVGTVGFLPDKGTGDPQADVYALGKVLYEAATGMDRNAFPDLPPDVRGRRRGDPLLQLNALLLRACSPEEDEQFADAAEFGAALERINAPSFFAGPYTWREKRLLAIAAGLALLLAVSDGILIYLGTRESPPEEAKGPAVEAIELRGKISGETRSEDEEISR
mgnify:CR=1 FL=1